MLEIAIARSFPQDRARVETLLRRDYPLTRETGRIGLAIVFLSRGDEERVRHWLESDWRDILVAAENTKVNAAAFFAWIAALDAAAGHRR